MNKPLLHRRYDLALGAIIMAFLLLVTLLLAGSARAVSGYPKGVTDGPEAQFADSLGRRQFTDSTSAGHPQARVKRALRSSPVMFIENAGQWNERARFQVRGATGTMWLAREALSG